MQRFTMPEALQEDYLLLPDLYVPEQDELVAYLKTYDEQLCKLSELAQAIFLWRDRGTQHDRSDGRVVCVALTGQGVLVAEENLSAENSSLAEDGVVIMPRDGVSAGYLAAALRTEMCRRQLVRHSLIERGEASFQVWNLGELKVPRPGTAQGKDLVRQVLLSRTLVETAQPPPYRYLPAPFSEAEVIANTLLVTDSMVFGPTSVDASASCLFVEHLTVLEEGNQRQDEAAYPGTLITVTPAGTTTQSVPLTGVDLCSVLEGLKAQDQAFGLVRLPEGISKEFKLTESRQAHAFLQNVLQAWRRDASTESPGRPFYVNEFKQLIVPAQEKLSSLFASLARKHLTDLAHTSWLSVTHPDEDHLDSSLWEQHPAAEQERHAPALAVKLPSPPDGPGGIIIKPWPATHIGFTAEYHARFLANLTQQMGALRQSRRKVADEIVGRIRHMFKNRIGGIRTDVQELRKAASGAAWSHDSVINPDTAQRMIRRKGFAADHYEVGAYLERVEKALDSVTQIVDRISRYYRAGVPHPVQVNVAEELSSKLRAWKNTRVDIAVEETYDTLPAVVRMDLERFREVLDNILCNSAEHLPPDSAHKLQVAVEVRRDKVIVEIANTGPGDLPVNPKEPYVTTSKTGGTGLGLAIVDRNVREAGGTFDLLQRPDGPGVINRILLPNSLWEVGGISHA